MNSAACPGRGGVGQRQAVLKQARLQAFEPAGADAVQGEQIVPGDAVECFQVRVTGVGQSIPGRAAEAGMAVRGVVMTASVFLTSAERARPRGGDRSPRSVGGGRR